MRRFPYFELVIPIAVSIACGCNSAESGTERSPKTNGGPVTAGASGNPDHPAPVVVGSMLGPHPKPGAKASTATSPHSEGEKASGH